MITGVSHIGIAVFSLDEALKFYRDILGFKVSGMEEVESEGVRVAILPVGKTCIELLEPLHQNSPLYKTLQKRGEGVHHIALETESIRETLGKLSKGGVKALGEPHPGAGGSQICFLHPKSTHGVLLELCESPD